MFLVEPEVVVQEVPARIRSVPVSDKEEEAVMVEEVAMVI